MLSPTENSRNQGLQGFLVRHGLHFQYLIFKDFSRKPSKFKYFSSLCQPCILAINPFKTNGISHSYQLDLSISILAINPFKTNGISHLDQLDESISNFRVVEWYFSFFFQILKDTFQVKN